MSSKTNAASLMAVKIKLECFFSMKAPSFCISMYAGLMAPPIA